MGSDRGELAAEQAYVDTLYARLDELREGVRARLTDVRHRGATGTPQARSERDAFAAMYEDRLVQLDAVENGLCFGRLDLVDGARHHIGRIGLFDDSHNAILVDWRAPAAEAFYRATAADPHGVARRRHLRTRGRAVLNVDDEVFGYEALSDADRSTLSGEAALLAALTEHRTGHMRDIVATIQGEQDRAIRGDLGGILVVQGGPGTGKTAVALHRAAYLLYTHRDRLARSGVLVVGPNPVFVHYIDQVLPSLGETGVVLSTVEGLVRGVRVTSSEPREVAALKGDRRMAKVIRNALSAHQRVPGVAVVVPYEDGDLVLEPRVYNDARRRAQRSRRPHNLARLTFARALLEELTAQACALHNTTTDESPWVPRSIMSSQEFRSAVNDSWPSLTAEQLVESLFASPAALRAAGRGLSERERDLLARPVGTGWTQADMPLLDEARVVLGDVETVLRAARERRERRAERRYAREVLELTGTAGQVDPDSLARRYRDAGRHRSVVERASQDPDWEFGHVVVDEAQELSAMAWRMLVRRCPARSMTVVGDVAQTGVEWGARSWDEMLDPVAPGRWRVAELTVNYRTPQEVMRVAADVLSEVHAGATPPASVRTSGGPPWAVQVGAAELADRLAAFVVDETRVVAGGRVAVLAPDSLFGEIAAALVAHVPGAVAGGPDALDAPVAVLPVRQAKGLEFDSVLVVEPARILEDSPLGGNDLYVALTRTTTRLGVVHTGQLPHVLRRLGPGQPEPWSDLAAPQPRDGQHEQQHAGDG